jgi:hypothetical protein
MSLLLFVLAAEFLQCIINKAHLQNLFSLPLPSRDGAGYPIIQYADDTVVIMKASQRELFTLKALLQSFSQSTGLSVNYAKSCLVKVSPGAAVKLLPCDHEVMGSGPGNSFLQKCREMPHT